MCKLQLRGNLYKKIQKKNNKSIKKLPQTNLILSQFLPYFYF